MPLPSNLNTNASPFQAIESAVEQALEDKGVLSKKERAARALENAGLSIEDLAMHLANLIFTANSATKRNAILDAFGLHDINLKPDAGGQAAPTIVFQVQGENVNLNQLFAPNRETP